MAAIEDIDTNVQGTAMTLQQEWEVASKGVHSGLSDWLAQAAPGNGAQGYLDREQLIRNLLQQANDTTVAYGRSVRDGGLRGEENDRLQYNRISG
ncbi:MAG: hypothetical protein ACRCSN_17655 [Dermatophilaceae bacterium]